MDAHFSEYIRRQCEPIKVQQESQCNEEFYTFSVMSTFSVSLNSSTSLFIAPVEKNDSQTLELHRESAIYVAACVHVLDIISVPCN